MAASDGLFLGNGYIFVVSLLLSETNNWNSVVVM